MSITVEDLSAQTGRAPDELTRRDVARALLTVPAVSALAELPRLRRALLAAGNPLSAPFWESAEQMLTAITEGRSTIGDVHRWLHATGSEPIDLVAGGFLWPDEGERGPVAREMHARLVAYLERLVAAGVIDPDRLCAGDADAWQDYERLQVEWLRSPLADGREPLCAVSDEEDDDFLRQWDDAEADARAILTDLLAGIPRRQRPDADLRAVCARLRSGLRSGDWPYDVLRAAGGVDPAALPADDEELWLTLASGVVSCADMPPDDFDDHAVAAWLGLTHADWIGAVVTLARLGPGAPADADSLGHYAATFDFEEDEGVVDEWDDDDDDLWWDIDGPSLADQVLSLAVGFGTVALLWIALGVVDADDRLTPLGSWGVPLATLRAWQPQ